MEWGFRDLEFNPLLILGKVIYKMRALFTLVVPEWNCTSESLVMVVKSTDSWSLFHIY